jgi:hypothetical protein
LLGKPSAGEGAPVVVAATGTTHGTGTAVGVGVRLSEEVDQVGISVADHVALQDANLRKWMVDRVVPAFLKANGLTLIALAVLVVLDEINIASHLIAPGDRIITEKVIMALLGATTVQVGAIAALIARYLFPSRPA